MKNIILILLISIIVVGCAKKNYQLETAATSKQTKSNLDSTGIRKTDIQNKSIIVHEKNADSTIVISADSLKGIVNIFSCSGNDSLLTSHFENVGLTLDLLANRKTGVINAVVKSKPRTAHLAVHEKTTVNQNIHSTMNDRSKIQSTFTTIADSTSKKETKQTDPSGAISGIKTVVVWIFIALVLCGVGIYFGRKMLKSYMGVN